MDTKCIGCTLESKKCDGPTDKEYTCYRGVVGARGAGKCFKCGSTDVKYQDEITVAELCALCEVDGDSEEIFTQEELEEGLEDAN